MKSPRILQSYPGLLDCEAGASQANSWSLQQLSAPLYPAQTLNSTPLLRLLTSICFSLPNSTFAVLLQQLGCLLARSHSGSSLLFPATPRYSARSNSCFVPSQSTHGEDKHRSNSTLAPWPSINTTARYVPPLFGNPHLHSGHHSLQTSFYQSCLTLLPPSPPPPSSPPLRLTLWQWPSPCRHLLSLPSPFGSTPQSLTECGEFYRLNVLY